MNKTEQIAYNWFLTQKILEKDIIYQKAKSPDFILKNGKSYEVKKLYGNKVLLSKNQFENLKRDHPNCILLIIDENSKEPILAIPTKQIKENSKIIDGLMINWISDDKTGRLVADIEGKKKRIFSAICSLMNVDEKKVIEKFVDDFITKNKGVLKDV